MIVARFDGNPITGGLGGENFAHIIDPPAHARYEAALHRVAELARTGTIVRSGGWEVYRAMHDLPDERILEFFPDGSPKNPRLAHFVEIIDGSEDMDAPYDWDQWCWRYARYSTQERERYGMTR